MPSPNPFRIAIIGSGPVGTLLIASVTQHPLIEYIQYEAKTLPLRPSFGCGIGPQTFATVKILNPPIYEKILEQSFTSPVWLNIRHELMDLLDGFAPEGFEVRYGLRVTNVIKSQQGRVKMSFEDGTEDNVDAVWACDGMNSLGRKLIQGDEYKPAEYSGMICFRGKVGTEKVAAAVGEELASKTHMFIGGTGYFVLIFPIVGGKYVNIACFMHEKEHKKRGRAWKTGLGDMPAYFPEANPTLLKLLEVNLMVMKNLGAFHNPDLHMTSFGDAANGMLPHMGGSMSTGFIGVTTFLHSELNPRLESLSPEASNEEIAKVITDASIEYEKKHMPLAQKLCDYSIEQGAVFTGGVLDIDEIQRRPKSLWRAATSQKVGLWE
ncbi:related to salicylate 1-monooxygenase [Phialocephala subalpina]|uniref:Related to salicylate 1-monooxygenase n=1 Tax=Phialocephala subalpina TaxID=576137 RepID=A0A1L7XBK2_9HELO|nr:related to salicylate 1-monooxygenase [Phialocephala subalpina]